jgi:poly-gamma-glutamate synthesis protein (capsule biosynthesis protein)
VPVAAPPPTWLATGVELRIPFSATAAGTAELVRVAPGPEAVVAHADVAAGAAGALTTTPPRTGRYRYRLVLPGETARAVVLRVRPVSLAAVGDVSPGSAIADVRAHGPSWHWAKVGPWLRARDLVVANLETAVGTGGRPWPGKNYHFLSPPATIRAMARSGGVDVVTVANNHGVDYGRRTFASGLRTIHRAGVLPVGGGTNLTAALAPAVVERGGLKIAFVGFDAFPPYRFWAGDHHAGLAPGTDAAVRASVRVATQQADLVVAYLHWGTELRTSPGPKQRHLARVAFAAGADVVLGAHPHVLQPIRTRSGGRLVAYSLGNFVFHPGSSVARRSAALALELGKRGVLSYRLRRVQIVGSRPVWR